MSSLNNNQFSRFVSPWPVSALDLEFQERKRLKRYARSEQKRRLEKQLQKMNILNVPIYDLALDDEAELFVDDTKYYPSKTDVLWPILPTNKHFNNNSNQSLNSKSVNVLLPNQNWTSSYEGVFLSAGSEIKANIPIIKERRYLNFIAFPLTPGNIRIILGQYVWAKTFGEEEVHKVQKINIPINDPTATNIRVISISCSCYLLDMSINQTQRNGREPIKVAIGSSLWSPNKKYLINQFQENMSLIENDNDNSDETIDDSKNIEDNNTDNNTDNNADNKKEEPKQTPIKEPQYVKIALEDNDPILQTANNQLLMNNEYTTAFGYNVIFIQTPPIDTQLLKNQKIIKKVAPNISSLMENSVFFDNNITALKNNNSLFRETIFQNYNNLYDMNPTIFKYKIEHNDIENTYQKFRRYGYKVVSITSPESLFFSKNISNNTAFSKFYNRWLDEKDWQFQNKNLKIDEKLNSSTGLDAIFNLDNSKKIQPPLTNNDYSLISKYLTDVSLNINKIPNWHPNEYMLISNKNYYTAKVVSAFQNWAEGYNQTRFFAHISLDSNNNLDRPNLTNLKKSFLASGIFSLTRPKDLQKVTEISYLDIAIGDILSTIKAKRIENRSLIFLIIPDKDGNKNASGIYKIPGLIGKKVSYHNIVIQDILATIFSNVGIPTGSNLKSIPSNSPGNMLETKNYITQTNLKSTSKFLKYTLLLKPNTDFCDRIIWKSNTSNLLDITANYPVYRIIDPHTLEIYPCSIPNKFIEFTWYQNQNTPATNNFEQSEIIENIGGHFYYFKSKKNFPEVFFGKNLISYNSLIFMFRNLDIKNIQNIFYVNESDLKQIVAKTRLSFFGYDDINVDKKSKMALFITPL